MRILLAVLGSLFLLCACHQEQPNPSDTPKKTLPPAKASVPPKPVPAEFKAFRLLDSPCTPAVVENPALALATWREFRPAAPTLLLLSNNPFLLPGPASLQAEIRNLLETAAPSELQRQATSLVADPVLLPAMAVRAALEQGYFSRLVWIFPSSDATLQLNLEQFRRQLLDAGLVSTTEAETLQLANGTFHGRVAGIPFVAAPSTTLPKLQGAVVLHLDLSYLQRLYKGEIKTPLYPLLGQTLQSLQGAGYDALAVTLSLSNLEGGIPLASRFVGFDLATIFSQPAILKDGPPAHWAQRASALYLENFFKKDEVRDIYQKLEQRRPDDPSIKYALYSVSREFKEGDKALSYLADAVRIDPAYGLEYQVLAQLARDKNLPDQELRMLLLASNALPSNPFFKLAIAEQMLAGSQRDHAQKLLQELQQLPWSEIYYPDIAEHLQKLRQP